MNKKNLLFVAVCYTLLKFIKNCIIIIVMKKNESDKVELETSAETSKDDEISLIDLLAVIWNRKWIVIGLTVFAAIFSLVFSIISIVLPPEKSYLPNKYTPKAQMLINNSDSSSSSLSGTLASVSALAGINLNTSGGISYSELAKYLVNSNTVLDSVVKKYNFIEEWEIKKSPKTDSRKMLQKKLTCDFDDDSGIFTVSFTDTDPVLAQSVVNYVVEFLEQRFKDLGVNKNEVQKTNLEENINAAYNQIVILQKQIREIESSVSNVYSPNAAPSIMMDTSLIKMELSVQEEVYKQLKAQYETLKITMASEQPIFQILEYAEVPDSKSGPSRGKLCIIITFAAFFVSIFIVFALNAISNMKKDPEVVQKFKGKNL